MRGSWARSASVLLVGVALVQGGAPAAFAQESPAPVDQATFDETEQVVDSLLDDTNPDSLSAFWTETFPTFSDQPYHDPQGGFFPYVTGEPSGGGCAEAGDTAAQNAMYCRVDESITYDIEWLSTLDAKHGIAGPITLMGHEWGHHIQALAGSPEISKQAELQADCYSGMYLGFLTDQGLLVDDDVTAMLEVAYEIGDQSDASDWTDPEVHGKPEERRQAAGIGFSTGDGNYCVAYGDWQDEPAAELFGGNLIRLEPFADPAPLEDGSFGIELPGAQVQVFEVEYPAGTVAADELAAAVMDSYPDDAPGWELSEPQADWIESSGWATGTGAQLTFTGTFADGSAAGGAAAMLLDPDGSGQLFVGIGADEADVDTGVVQAQAALAALTWGYCDPEAEVTDNCSTS